MDVRFDARNIDNSAINIVIDQLVPFLRYDPDSEFRILDNHNSSEKHKVLYEQIFLPYCTESREHFYYHHNDAPTESWQGEQVCLSMIHTINQKAWWLLYNFTIIETTEEHSKISRDRIKEFAHKATICILDGDSSIRDAVNYCISRETGLEKYMEDMIVEDITKRILGYKKEPSHPMMYR